MLRYQATVEKIYKCLTEDNKDVRKGEWNNKEVRLLSIVIGQAFLLLPYMKRKSTPLDLTQLVEEGVGPPIPA